MSLNKTDTSQLRPLVRVLGWMQHESAPQALTGLLGAEEVRKDVVEVLLRYGHRVTEQLIPQLEHRDSEVRRAAIMALGRVGDPTAVPALIRTLVNDPGPDHSGSQPRLRGLAIPEHTILSLASFPTTAPPFGKRLSRASTLSVIRARRPTRSE